MNELLSIVIPVYNAEKYLNRCIDSIINQNYENYELILINDGSSDESSEICLEYLEKHIKKIKYINQENKGVSYSRNRGIECAQGSYITFVDADDYIDKDIFLLGMEAIKATESELLIFGVKEVDIDIKEKELSYKEGEFFLKKDYKKLAPVMFNSVWNKIYKTELIRKNKIEFVENAQYFEDLCFVFKYMTMCKKVYFLDKTGYFYIKNSNSITSSGKGQLNRKFIPMAQRCFIDLKDFLINKNKLEEYRESFEYTTERSLIKNIKKQILKFVKKDENYQVLSELMKIEDFLKNYDAGVYCLYKKDKKNFLFKIFKEKFKKIKRKIF